MKFKLTTTRWSYEKEDIENLEKLGFKFEETKGGIIFPERTKRRVNDSEIIINSIEELATFAKEWGELVVSEDEIEIYDDYRE